MIKVGIISDTHNFIDDGMLNFLNDCDELWHAGDIGYIDFLNKLQNYKPLKAVFGNADDITIRKELKEYKVFTIFNTTILIKHNCGWFSKYNTTTKNLILQHKPSILVCGHTHILTVKYDNKNNLLYINPGAAGMFGQHLKMTAIKIDIYKDKVDNLIIFEKDKYANSINSIS